MPRATILLPRRRSIVSSIPTTIGAVAGTKNSICDNSMIRRTARLDHLARLRTRSPGARMPPIRSTLVHSHTRSLKTPSLKGAQTRVSSLEADPSFLVLFLSRLREDDAAFLVLPSLLWIKSRLTPVMYPLCLRYGRGQKRQLILEMDFFPEKGLPTRQNKENTVAADPITSAIFLRFPACCQETMGY